GERDEDVCEDAPRIHLRCGPAPRHGAGRPCGEPGAVERRSIGVEQTMNVRCSNCNTLYRIDPARIPPGGVNARCARCQGTFRIEPAPVAAGGGAAAPAPGGPAPVPPAAPAPSAPSGGMVSPRPA